MIRVLIISQFITPALSVASIRWTKISKYLSRNHPDTIRIDVLTDEKNFDGKYPYIPKWREDLLLKKDMTAFDRYIVIPPSKRISNVYKLRELGKQPVKSNENNYSNEKRIRESKRKSNGLLYEGKCIETIIDAKKVLKNMDIDLYDVIISSSGPQWTHGIASWIKKRNSKVVWFADYRDMCFDNLEPSVLKAWHKFQSYYYTKRADVIISILDSLPLDVSKKIPKYIVSNGFDYEERKSAIISNQFYIVYTGSVQDNERTDFGILFRAINELVSERKMDLKDVKVIYAGKQGNVAKKYAKANGGENFFEDKGFLERTEAVELQRKASILLQCSFNTSKFHFYWTGKMYEYMMSGKPILYIVNGNEPYSLPAKYMNKLGGYCYESCRHEETYFGMKSYIQEKYKEWKRVGKTSVVQDKKYIDSFSYEIIAERIWKLISDYK